MSLKRLTPVLFVERIEPCLELWEKCLDFKRVASVPEGDRLGFVILARDGIEIMYQTWTSVTEDLPALANESRASRHFLFIEVADIAVIESRLRNVDYVVRKRETFYGMTEVIIRDAAGHVIAFAQQTAKK